jgi:hypothetical protein
MRFTAVDVVYVSGNVQEASQAFSEVSQKLPNQYISCHMTISELLASDNMPYALLVLVTPDLLTSPAFVDLSEYILKKMNGPDGRSFRAYMIPYRMSFEELKELLDRGTNEPLNQIGDVVHIDAFKDHADLIGEVSRFLNNERNAARFYAYTKLRDVFKICLGFMSGILILGCSLAAYSISMLYFLKIANETWAVSALYQWIADVSDLRNHQIAVQMLLGISLVIPIANILYLCRFGLKQFIPQTASSLKGLKSKLYFASTSFGFILTILYICAAVQPGIGIFILSLALGFCMDGIRRLYYRGYRGFIVRRLDTALCTEQREKLSKKILLSGQRSMINALRIPYLQPKRARVFISYTHSCDWSTKVVDRMYRQFSQDGLICFVDKHGISRGSSWRRAIHEKMSDATHVICVASENTVRKEWPAAEIEAALRMRAATGSPMITVMLPESLDESEIEKITAVYKEIFARQGDRLSFVRTIREIDGGVQALSHSLACQNACSGLLGSVFHHLWRAVFDLAEGITMKAKNILTLILGISFLGYISFLVIQNFTALKTLEDFFTICATRFSDMNRTLSSSWFRHPVWILACYFLAVEIVSILDDLLLVGYKNIQKTYLISKMIVLSLSAIIITLLIAYIPFAIIVFGVVLFVAGGFLASSANRTQVEINGMSYYRNDANKGMIKLPALFSPVGSSAFKTQLETKAIDRTKAACLDVYHKKRGSAVFRASECFGIGLGDAGLMKQKEAYIEILAASEDFAASKGIIVYSETLGDISVYLGDYEDAVYHYRKAIANLYAAMDLTVSDDLRLVQCYCNLALLCKHHGVTDEAKKYARIALANNKVRDEHTSIELNAILNDM